MRRRVQILSEEFTQDLENKINEYIARLEELHQENLTKVKIQYHRASELTQHVALIYYEFAGELQPTDFP